MNPFFQDLKRGFLFFLRETLHGTAKYTISVSRVCAVETNVYPRGGTQNSHRRFSLNKGLIMEHPLHKIVGEYIGSHKFPNCKIIKDPACGGEQNVPLFCSEDKSNKTEYCNVDLLILKDDKIRVIIEIEETDIKPIQICGKFLTSALSRYFIHECKNNVPVGMSDSVSFIQILNTARLKAGAAKIGQWENLEKSIMNILPIEGSKIRKYKLLYGNISDFERRNSNKCAELVTCVRNALKWPQLPMT